MPTELQTRVTKIEAFAEAHYDDFKIMYQNNREDHEKFFNKLENLNVNLTEVKDMTQNHLKHHERLFALLLVFLGMVVPFMIFLTIIA